MREISWFRGRARLAASPAEWPSATAWQAPSGQHHTLSLPALARGASAAVTVTRVCQTASGGSFYAHLGGQMRPGPGGVLEVDIALLDDPCMDLVLSCVLEALEAMPAHDRPAGHLEIGWFRIHPVDLARWAWRDAAATMCRLLREDIATLDDAQLSALAARYAPGLPWASRW